MALSGMSYTHACRLRSALDNGNGLIQPVKVTVDVGVEVEGIGLFWHCENHAARR